MGQAFLAQVGVKAPQAPEPLVPRAEALQGRNDNLPGRADDDGLDLAPSVYQKADLAARLLSEGGNRAGYVRGEKLRRRDASSIKALKGFELTWFQTCKGTVKGADCWSPPKFKLYPLALIRQWTRVSP